MALKVVYTNDPQYNIAYYCPYCGNKHSIYSLSQLVCFQCRRIIPNVFLIAHNEEARIEWHRHGDDYEDLGSEDLYTT